MRTSSLQHRLILGALSLLVLTSACTKKAPPRARPPVPVVVSRARLADVPYTIDATGVVVPLQSAAVGSQVEGVIQKVLFTEGQNVRQGQELFQIDPRPYRAAYQQAQAMLARDKANAVNARAEALRYATLAKQDYVTKEQADQQTANAAAADANLAGDSALVATAKFNLDNTIIRAPIAGRTGVALVRQGNLAHANGATPLVVINQLSPVLVRFAIPATQLPLLQKYGSAGGLGVTATPNSGADQSVDSSSGGGAIGLSMGGGDPGSAASGGASARGDSTKGRGRAPRGGASSLLAGLFQPEKGKLSFIDNAVDTTTSTVLLRATFPNSSQRLWAGEIVAATLDLFVEQQALVVPTAAVVTGQQGQYVYVVSDSMTAQQRTVVVERTAGDIMIIASGLRAGDQIVIDGQSRLTPNSKVTISTPNGGSGGRRGGKGGRGGRRGGAASGDSTAAPTPGAGAPPAAAPEAAGAANAGGAASDSSGGRRGGGRHGGRGGRGGRKADAGSAPASPDAELR